MEYNYIQLYLTQKTPIKGSENIFNNACCFFGHRKIVETEKLKNQLYETIESLIKKEKVDVFLFGSKSSFDSLCYEIVTKIKEKHPHIKRIYVRVEYPNINDEYNTYLLNHYEQTYYPQKIIGATKAVYIKRNYEMIDNCEFCIVYFKNDSLPKSEKSGTKIALDYALKHNKTVILFPQ